jgi:ubiquinone/menaquinone biosynthesis C-methylase UbiE
MLEEIPQTAVRGAYRAQQASIRYGLMAAHGVLRAFQGSPDSPSPAALEALEREYRALLERDLANAEAGLYPSDLLFQIPLREYALAMPRFLLDLPRVVGRLRRKDWRDLPDDLDPGRFPSYFLRTFHWQTDGYLSSRSASIYDLSVEVLFLGCADVMRRQVIPPLVRHLGRRKRSGMRLLEVACGTGRTLGQLARALPGQRYFGVDLSPHYLEQARQHLADIPEVTLVAENAEKLPYRDAYFDATTSVYLFHELPRRTRARVMEELFRVTKPGGVVVLEDSAQLAEAADLAPFLENFSRGMHEPFYRDYIKHDLSEVAEAAGFEVQRVERAWLSKVVTALRPR